MNIDFLEQSLLTEVIGRIDSYATFGLTLLAILGIGLILMIVSLRPRLWYLASFGHWPVSILLVTSYNRSSSTSGDRDTYRANLTTTNGSFCLLTIASVWTPTATKLRTCKTNLLKDVFAAAVRSNPNSFRRLTEELCRASHR